MRQFDTGLENWALVSYKDDTGLGRMAEDARCVLGIGHQLVVPSRRLQNKPLEPGDFLLSETHAETELRDFLSERDGILVFEKADWTPSLLPLAKELGLAIAAVPMWEWFRRDDPLWSLCDRFICPNRKSFEVVRSAGFENATILPWALDLSRLPARKISGPGRAFIHNAGLVDQDDRKGTRDTIEAFGKVTCAEARLGVRLQEAAVLLKGDARVEICVGNLARPSDLWAVGEVAIQPSKMEGLGLMVLEPICAGLPVITLDVGPMNEYAAELLVKPRWLSQSAFAAQWIPQARLRIPSRKGLTEMIEHATRIDLAGISRRQRCWAEETFDRATLGESWSRALHGITRKNSRAVCV